jgi:hypothetical protein
LTAQRIKKERSPFFSVSSREGPDGAAGAPAPPQPLSPRETERKESNKMKWMQKLLERGRKTETKAEPKEETRPEALRIQELEARVAPNAVWGE